MTPPPNASSVAPAARRAGLPTGVDECSQLWVMQICSRTVQTFADIVLTVLTHKVHRAQQEAGLACAGAGAAVRSFSNSARVASSQRCASGNAPRSSRHSSAFVQTFCSSSIVLNCSPSCSTTESTWHLPLSACVTLHKTMLCSGLQLPQLSCAAHSQSLRKSAALRKLCNRKDCAAA